jgi:hypothetical protein
MTECGSTQYKSKSFRVMAKLLERFPQLDAKPRMMLKTIALKTLSSTAEDYPCDMSFLFGLSQQVIQVAMMQTIKDAEEDKCTAASAVLLDLVDEQLETLKHRKTAEMPQSSVFGVDYHKISMFLATIFSTLQSLLMSKIINFEELAKITQSFIRSLINSLGGDEPQVLMHCIVTDLCVVFNHCSGAPLDYPVFTLFTKCLLLELL